jgi:[ribosomal protein S5]-alanine N-acetyltransferase
VPEPLIRLRAINEEDEFDVFTYASHELIAATTNVPHPYPREAASEFIREAIRKSEIGEALVFAVVAEERFVGLVSIFRQPSVLINFGIAVPFWNKGYATAAVSEAIAHAKSELHVTRIEASCLCENIASRRVMLKNGFRKVGQKIYDGPRIERFRGRILEIYRRDL